MRGLDDGRQAVPVRIPAYAMLDLTARAQIAKRTEISVVILNFFNAEPTAIETALASETPYDTTNYSPTGRFVGLTIRKRSEEHTSELQSLMRNSYAVFCLKTIKPKTN